MQNKWEKSGDFTQSNRHNAPRYEVSYLSTTASFNLSKIRIIGYDDGKIGFSVLADVKSHRSFFSQKFKPLESYFFITLTDDDIYLHPIDDKVALHQAFKIINEIAKLEEHQAEIESILGIQNICLPSQVAQDVEDSPVKNQLYSAKGYRYGNFDLRIDRPALPVMYARPIFSIIQDNGKELYMAVSAEMVAHIIQSIEEKKFQALAMKFKESASGYDIGLALQKGAIRDLITIPGLNGINEEQKMRFSPI